MQVRGDPGRSAAEAGLQIHHRDHRAAQIDHPTNAGRHQRDLGQLAELDDLAHREGIHRIGLTVDHEGQVLMAKVFVGDVAKGQGSHEAITPGSGRNRPAGRPRLSGGRRRVGWAVRLAAGRVCSMARSRSWTARPSPVWKKPIRRCSCSA